MANLTFLDKDSMSMIELRQTPSHATLELSPPGKPDPGVSLSAHEYGASLSLNRSPPTSTSPVRLWVGEEGAGVSVNDKQLGAATR